MPPRDRRQDTCIFVKNLEVQRKKKHPDLRMGGISKELGKLWGTYSPEEKEPYNDKSMVDRNRYDEEIEEYNLNNL